MRSPFLGLTLAAVTGIILADNFPEFQVAITIFAFLAAILVWRWPSTLGACLLVALAFYSLHARRAESSRSISHQSLKVATVTGTVMTEPKKDVRGQSTFLLRVREARFDQGEDVALSETVLTRWRGAPEIGDTLILFGTLDSVEPPRNPGEFDLRAYLARKNVKRVFVVHSPENGRILDHGSRFNILRAAGRSRAWMQRTLSRGLEDSPDVAGLICGTSLGLRHQTADDIEEPFQQTGTLHLFAVAGLHVGIVATLLWTVASVLRLPRKIAVAGIIPLLFFYAAITGLHTASLRAAVMSAIMLGGIFFDRRVFALNSLAAAAFLILLVDSNELFTSGFQLSFCVVGSIVFFADKFSIATRKLVQPDPFFPRSLFGPIRRGSFALLDHVANGFAISLAAWLGSLPLVYWYFHLVTPVSLVANLAVVPLAYFILALALLSLLSAPLSLSIIFNNANWLLSRIVLALVHFFAVAPESHFYLARPHQRLTPISATVLDEGTGGALHFRADNYDWLIDCGSTRHYPRTLKEFLHMRGVGQIEGLVLTHGDAQHLGAAPQVIADFLPREFYLNPLDVRSSSFRRLHETVAEKPRALIRGDQLMFGPDVAVQILYPPPDLSVKAADDAPLIARIEIADRTSLLLESDAGADAEAALVAAGDGLESDILIKGQNHRGGSGTRAFLDAVKPQLVIATSRESPLNEQITEQFVQDLAERGIKLFRQDQTGAVEIEFAENGWRARSFITNEIVRGR